METPDRDDEPVDTWSYRDHECRVYASDDPVDGETVWAGYAHSKLPAGLEADDVDVAVPGSLTTAVEDGWVGFSTSEGPRDAAETRRDVEDLVDQLVGLETTMDG